MAQCDLWRRLNEGRLRLSGRVAMTPRGPGLTHSGTGASPSAVVDPSTMLRDPRLGGIHSAVGAIIEATLGELSIAGIVCVVCLVVTRGGGLV
jgi:hypothetical protein